MTYWKGWSLQIYSELLCERFLEAFIIVPQIYLYLKNEKAALAPPENSNFSIRLADGQKRAILTPLTTLAVLGWWEPQPAHYPPQPGLSSGFSGKQSTVCLLKPISTVPSLSVGADKEALGNRNSGKKSLNPPHSPQPKKQKKKSEIPTLWCPRRWRA